jgi:hypothetical protein
MVARRRHPIRMTMKRRAVALRIESRYIVEEDFGFFSE